MDTPPQVDVADRFEVEDAHGKFTPPRRGFLYQFSAGFLGLLAGLIPAGIALPFLLDPLLRREKGQAGGGETTADGVEFVPVANLDAIPRDGTPMLFTIFKDRLDKWNKFPNERVGSVWLRYQNGAVVAFNSVCPHLGCTVDYRPAAGDFYCPCHASAFDLAGAKKNVIPPRDMDTLATKVTEDERVLVAFQNFQGGLHDKEPV
jgi:menaquinol-cytochrome c reductase iron-sulfur subunit